ncbi:ABC transporter ATP-binding protein [Paenibacillus kandeliae]|uniref:ABC transporter ATP-binding protein n=1 Tax=Paenibacillus kandeliae TaxID=3231269 RepID=UPI00345872E7
MLALHEVSIFNRQHMLVDHVSLSLRAGEWLALVGQSGSGKSLLSQGIGQMLPSPLRMSGSVLFQGQELTRLSPSKLRHLRGRQMAYAFQDYQGSFTPFLRIGQHLDEYQRVHGEKSRSVRRRKGIEALESVGLDGNLYERYPFQLSGGQLQRAAIALALLLSPSLLIADEVTTALDSVSGHRILELLRDKQRETGCGILFITHDWRHVRRYADRLAVMKDGKIVEAGHKHRVLDHPQHEYTRQLIAAAPMLERPGHVLTSGLEGAEPS